MNEGAINAAVIGFGHAGERIHVPLIRLSSRVKLRGVCSGDPAKRQRVESQIGCRTYDNLQGVLADQEVQLVVLATPNRLHAAQGIAAMRAGKHVLIDKPMCLGSRECEELIDCAKSTGLALSVFHNRRFDSDYLTLRGLLERGEIGQLRWLEMSWQRAALPRSWKQDASLGGGRLIDLGSHLIDQALQLMGAPVATVFCRMQHDYAGLDIESHAMLTLCFVDGRTAVIDTTGMTHAPKPRFRALGSRATFVKYGIDPQEAALSDGRIDVVREAPDAWGTLSDESGERRIETAPGRWTAFYEQLGGALAQWPAGELPVTAQDAARVVRVLEAAAESAASGRVVAINV